MYRKYVKRILDIVLSLCVLIIFSPIYILIAVLIKLDSKGPVFFKQTRIGKNKENFNILKFRTMRVDAPHDMPTHMLKNPEQWITRVGRVLRKTSLDELPQFFQILSGKMSLVGPRPALWNQDELIKERDKYGANEILPGLTGWAQINGRDELDILSKAKLDGEYVQDGSFGMDVTCFLMTITAVFKARNVVEGSTGALANSVDASDEEASG